jgi:dTDP-4-dehydrorhamnose reductase
MKILVTGGSGMLGTALKKVAEENFKDIIICSPTRFSLDIMYNESVSVCLKAHRPDIVIHAAAITQEKIKHFNRTDGSMGTKLAYITNIIGTMKMARICQNFDVPMVYISTDYIFDGKHGNYSEDAIPNPPNYYALTKFGGEMASLTLKHRVIRTSFCPMEWPHDKAFEDKFSSRDTDEKIAELIIKSTLKFSEWDGILHVGTSYKSFYDLAKKLKPDVKPNSIKDIKDQYIPQDTSFNLGKMNKLIGSNY